MKEHNKYSVYRHITPCGKSYIGITSTEPEKRWKNGKGYELCTAFNRAINKYGWENIAHEILATGLSKAQACEKEKEYILLFQSADPLYGYNLTHGGEMYEPNQEWRERASQSHKKYYAEHPEAKAQISERQKGKKAKESTKAKMSASRRKYIEEHPEAREQCRRNFKGKKRSEANREKLREANYKQIICVETGETFRSIQEAALAVGVCRSSLSNLLTGRSKTCGGYHFEYLMERNTCGGR